MSRFVRITFIVIPTLSVIGLMACGVFTTLGPTGDTPSSRGSPPEWTGPRCDDSVVESSSVETPPPMAQQKMKDISMIVFVGSGDTWFMGPKGGRWGGIAPQFFNGNYFIKVGIYTLESHPPKVTVRRADGRATGRAEFRPESEGLPGPLPTGFYFPTPGCWDVTARGTTGSAIIRFWIDAR